MTRNYEPENTVMRLWHLLHRIHDVLITCEDSIFRKYGITMEQFGVLVTVKRSGGSLRVTDLAFLLERKQNSVSMLIDRMVKAGLVKKTSNNRLDRRVVNVVLTGKGEKALEPAALAGWEFIQKILSPLSAKDKFTLANMLEMVKCECLAHRNPELDMSEIIRNSTTNQPNEYEEWLENVISPALKPNSQVR